MWQSFSAIGRGSSTTNRHHMSVSSITNEFSWRTVWALSTAMVIAPHFTSHEFKGTVDDILALVIQPASYLFLEIVRADDTLSTSQTFRWVTHPTRRISRDTLQFLRTISNFIRREFNCTFIVTRHCHFDSPTIGAQSTLRGKTFLPEKYVWKINKCRFAWFLSEKLAKFPNFTWHLPEKCPNFT